MSPPEVMSRWALPPFMRACCDKILLAYYERAPVKERRICEWLMRQAAHFEPRR